MAYSPMMEGSAAMSIDWVMHDAVVPVTMMPRTTRRCRGGNPSRAAFGSGSAESGSTGPRPPAFAQSGEEDDASRASFAVAVFVSMEADGSSCAQSVEHAHETRTDG